MNTDNYFRIGSTHKICQDFALSNTRVPKIGTINSDPFAIVCDGCSQTEGRPAEHTDIGARIIALAAKQHINSSLVDGSFINQVKATVDFSYQSLGLSEDAVSATMVVAKKSENFIDTLVFGDGVVAARDREGQLFFDVYRFVSGAPYYLRYDLTDKEKKNYRRNFGTKIELDSYRSTPEGFSKTTTQFDLDDDKPYFTSSYNINQWKTIGLFSDGVSAFEQTVITGTSKSKEIYPIDKVVPELMAFKNFAGEFVQRRAIKAFETFESNKIQATDDVSMAVIVLD